MRFEERPRGRVFGQIVALELRVLTVQVSDGLAAARSGGLEPDFQLLRHPLLPAPHSSSAQIASIISWIFGVHVPPQCPVVAVVFAATAAIVRHPSRIARSIVRYLMLLHRQTVLSPRITGWSISRSSSSIRVVEQCVRPAASRFSETPERAVLRPDLHPLIPLQIDVPQRCAARLARHRGHRAAVARHLVAVALEALGPRGSALVVDDEP